MITRLFAEQLSVSLKVPVVVENRGGANGQIAINAIAKASPDGYSFLSTSGTALTVNPVLQSSAADATLNQLTPITRLVNQDFVVTVRQSLQIHTLEELVAWSKKNPGKLNVATTALGSLAYLTAQLFKQTTGIDFVTVAHNGGGQAVGLVTGDHTDVLIETISLSRPHIETGKLVPIAVTGAKRSSFLPDVPTLREMQLNVEAAGWIALVAPKDTPPQIVGRVHKELAAALRSPELKHKLAEFSAEPVVDSPETFARTWRAEAEIWARVIKQTGIAIR